jgi:hypothetical protein
MEMKEAYSQMSEKGYRELEWEIRGSEHGDRTLLLGNRAVYSLFNPIEQVNSTAHEIIKRAREENCDHIIIIGLGLGYLPRALHNLGYKKIVVWEPFPIMQQSFPICGGQWQTSVNVVYNYSDFKQRVLLFAGKGAKPKLMVHPGYGIFCRLEYRLALQFLEKIYNDDKCAGYIVSKRALESLVRLPFLGTVKDFEGAYKGKKAILINPGPSLKQCISVLRDIDDSVIFASLQSAAFLQKNGIRTNFIVCADPKDMSPFLADCDDDFDAFFAETSVDPHTLDWKREKTYLIHFRCNQTHEILWEQSSLPIIEDPVSSVSEVMLLLANYMEFSEIYCIGMDFCWKEDRYSYRAKYKYDDDPKINDMMSTFELSTSDDQIASTQSVYFHGARYMKHKCSELRRMGKSVYQIIGGIDFTSTGILTVDELEKKLHSGKGRVDVKIVKQQSPINVEQVDRLLNDIKLGRIKSRQTNSDAGKMWPFLQGIPIEEQPEACDILINKLRSACIS